MAERFEPGTFGGWHGESRFPWDEWLDGGEWRLTYSDIDSAMDLENFAKYAHKVAKRRGLGLRTKRAEWDPSRSAWTVLWWQALDPYEGPSG